MARQPRNDYCGAVHHVFTRGVAQTAVARDDHDFRHALVLLEKVVSRYELVCHAWCFLPNHSHLLLTSQRKNISPAMQWLGARTAESFNRRYERSGHLYQGRFGSRLVEDDGYLLELARYLPLNPVKAGLCESPADWAWSSYSATAGLTSKPAFLETDAFLGASVRPTRMSTGSPTASSRVHSTSTDLYDPHRGRPSRACWRRTATKRSQPPIFATGTARSPSPNTWE